MSVKKGDRRDSKVEFDNIYFRMHDDAIKLIQNNVTLSARSERSFLLKGGKRNEKILHL